MPVPPPNMPYDHRPPKWWKPDARTVAVATVTVALTLPMAAVAKTDPYGPRGKKDPVANPYGPRHHVDIKLTSHRKH